MNPFKIVVLLLSLLTTSLFGEFAEYLTLDDELSLRRSLHKINCFKRSSIRHDNTKYLIFLGGVGSGIRSQSVFIYREQESRLELVYHEKVQRNGLSSIYPSIDGITVALSAFYKRQGEEAIDKFTLDSLKNMNQNPAEQLRVDNG